MEEMDYSKLITSVEERILSGGLMARQEADALLTVPDEHLMHLLAAADRVRIRFKGQAFDSCSLINARSGRCGEDCSFCAQSGRYNTGAETYPLCSTEEIVDAAAAARASGASRFCTVTSGGALRPEELDSLLESLEKVRSEVDIPLDASVGFLTPQTADRLKRAGVTRYNHNLETSSDYYPKICSTHLYEQRVETVRTAKAAGISACCGGIIGLGETPSQRLDLAFTLKGLDVDCIPINILNARPGTPLQDMPPLEPMEIVKTVALFRLINPTATIKIAGGREVRLQDYQGLALRSGANGMIIGGYLTTAGRNVDDDLRMIRQAGFVVNEPSCTGEKLSETGCQKSSCATLT